MAKEGPTKVPVDPDPTRTFRRPLVFKKLKGIEDQDVVENKKGLFSTFCVFILGAVCTIILYNYL